MQKISIHAPLAGRDRHGYATALFEAISIHAPLAGRDRRWGWPCPARWYFNPRAPCGARPLASPGVSCFCIFQSTRPLRGATFKPAPQPLDLVYFNPRAPCGARPARHGGGRSIFAFQSTRPLRGATLSPPRLADRRWDFNPRAPCGARLCPFLPIMGRAVFQSTRPLRGATRPHPAHSRKHLISIHAPLAGRDMRPHCLRLA